MYLFYIDESGDPGLLSEGSPTSAFVLSTLVVEDRQWLETLDEIRDFRRFLRQQFGLRQRDELKASYLLHGTGPFGALGISDAARLRIYKLALRFQHKVGTVKTWAIAIDKHKWESEDTTINSEKIRETAWQYMIQRIERFTYYRHDTCIVFPDEGTPAFVRAMFRRMRRFSRVRSMYDPQVSLSVPATLIVEDPNFRRSYESYFIQLADLNAYAAYRHIFPQSYFGANYWDQLGDARVREVNKHRGGPTGIVVWP